MKRKRNILKFFRMISAAAVLTAFVLHLAGIVRTPGIFRTMPQDLQDRYLLSLQERVFGKEPMR